ncbi:F-box domain-containing protein [Mycena kentingensis (nom. inval.)]|nr:F-box domain-containing protein [Mycena kentingensis (nom. inval.)]
MSGWRPGASNASSTMPNASSATCTRRGSTISCQLPFLPPTILRVTTMPPRRRARVAAKPADAVNIRGKLKLLVEMPLDVLFEIFSQLEPPDLLHLARTTKTLRAHIMHRSARGIWASVLRNDPDLPPRPDDLSEPAYVNLAFSQYCDGCLAPTPESILWAFRTRLCEECASKRNFKEMYALSVRTPHIKVHEFSELLRHGIVLSWGVYNKTLFSAEEAEELNGKLELHKDDAKKTAEILAEQKKFVKERQDHAFLAEKAGPRRTLRKVQERDAARKRRKNAICWRLSEIGYDEQVEYLNAYHPRTISEHSLVLSEELLTDEDWQQIRPVLSKVMEDITERMERKKRKLLIKTRQKNLITILKEYLAERPLDEVNPRAIDCCVIPDIKAMLLDPSKTAYASEDDFSGSIPNLPRICEEWRVSKDRFLLSLLPPSQRTIPDILARATTFFSCTKCNEPIGYPRVLAHACLTQLGHGHRNRDGDDEEVQMYTNLDSEPWNVDGRELRHWPEAAASARMIVRMCDLNEEQTTAKDMDDVRAWVECLRCRSREGRTVFRWRKAILHDMYHAAAKEKSRWRLMDEDEADAAEELEKTMYKATYSDARDFLCAHEACREQISFAQMRAHLAQSHGLALNGDPELEEDYVLHPDASMHQPPFAFLFPLKGKGKVVIDVDASPEVIEVGD